MMHSRRSRSNSWRSSTIPDLPRCGRGHGDRRGGRSSPRHKKPVGLTDARTGLRVKTKSKKGWGRYRDENGVEKRVPLATDKQVAQAILNELVVKAERRASEIEDVFDDHRRRPLKDRVREFLEYLQHKGSTADYVQTTRMRIESILRECRFECIEQISA